MHRASAPKEPSHEREHDPRPSLVASIEYDGAGKDSDEGDESEPEKSLGSHKDPPCRAASNANSAEYTACAPDHDAKMPVRQGPTKAITSSAATRRATETCCNSDARRARIHVAITPTETM